MSAPVDLSESGGYDELRDSLAFHADDRVALVEALKAILARQPDHYRAAITRLGRRVASRTGAELLKPYALAAYWTSAASRIALDDCFAQTWHDDEGVTELLGLIDAVRPEWACSAEDLAYFLLALSAGARGTLLADGDRVTTETAVRAATVTLAWAVDAERIDVLELLPDAR